MDKNFRIRLSLAFIVVALFSGAVIFRSAALMLFDSPQLTAAMERQFRQEPPRAPRRGAIVDRNREALAVSLDVRSLFANPGKIENKAQVAYLISRYLGLPVAQVRQKLKQDRGFVWIKRQLSEAEELNAKKLIDRNPQLNAVLGLAREAKRFYPNQSLASHVLGFTGLDSNGLEGVEYFYEKDLAGEVKNKNTIIEGKTIVLTIDKALQNILEMELEDGVKNTAAKSATAIILDASNGDVLAMSSFPTYNPNQFSSAAADHRRNRSVTDGYEPGSTMKPIVAAGAIEAKILTSQTKVFCEYGKMQIGKHWVSEAEAKDKWGWLKVEEVIQKSSNVGATKIGFLFGAQKEYEWLKKLGISNKTGIDLPGETSGALAEAQTWSKINHSNISFGQGVVVTPIQMARIYAALANGGLMIRPRIVKEILNAEGELLEEKPISTDKTNIPKEIADGMTQIMTGVATPQGTAPKAAIAGFTVAGKTGTAQKPIPGIGYKAGKYIASFIGYVKDVRPNYVVFVMVDEPKFPYFGGEAAAPIFQKIMTAALARAGVAPNDNLLPKIQLAQTPQSTPKQSASKAAKNIKIESEVAKDSLVWNDDPAGMLMPNLMGKTGRDVLQMFSKKAIDLKMKGSGVVVEQLPAPGSSFKKGDVISLRLERNAGP